MALVMLMMCEVQEGRPLPSAVAWDPCPLSTAVLHMEMIPASVAVTHVPCPLVMYP